PGVVGTPLEPLSGYRMCLRVWDALDYRTHLMQVVIQVFPAPPLLQLRGQHAGPARLAEVVPGLVHGLLPAAALALRSPLLLLAPPGVFQRPDLQLAQNGRPAFPQNRLLGVPGLRRAALPPVAP